MDNLQKLSSLCLYPRRVYNRYTGESILSPCGSCPSCLMNKRSKRVSSLMSYSLGHPHCLFVTLTYSDECIPSFFCSCVDSEGFRRPYSCLNQLNHLKESNESLSVSLLFDYERLLLSRISFFERIMNNPRNIVERSIKKYLSYSVILSYKSLLDTYSLLDDSENSSMFFVDPSICSLDKCLHYVSSRCSLKSAIPFPLVSDFQNFMKRLRKKILKNYGKKITYYAVSEYGPRSLRPHWHIMLFFDDLDFSQALSEAVRSCWLFGGCDTQLARTTGAAASYVASYLNSSCSLPVLYSHCEALRPRCLHSCGISSSYLFPGSASVEEAESVISRSLDGVGLRNSGGVISLQPPPSYIGRVFPRFRGIVGNDSSQLYDLYTSVVSILRRYIEESGLKFFEVKVSSFLEFFLMFVSKYNRTSDMPSCSAYRRILEFLRISNMHFKETLTKGSLLYYRLYRFFSKVLTFLRFWKIESSRQLRLAVNAIVEYHSRRARLLLASQFEMLSCFDVDSVNSYYSLCGYEDYSNSLLNSLFSYNASRVSSCIKHKVLNDNMLSSLC